MRPCFVNAKPAPGAEQIAAFADTLRLRGLADATREEYVRCLRKLATAARRDPAQLEEADVRAFLVELYSNYHYAPGSQRAMLCALRHFYRVHLGRDWRLLALLRAPREHGEPRGLTRGQVLRLFAAVTEPRFRVLLGLLYGCGLRVGEALALTWADIDEEGFRVWVRHGKGNRTRRVPLPPALLEELRAWRRMRGDFRWVFPGAGRGRGAAAQPMTSGALQARLRRVRQEVGLPEHTTPHALRHSYATHLLEEGVCVRVISACLGHSLLQTTLSYARVTAVSEERARQAADALMDKLVGMAGGQPGRCADGRAMQDEFRFGE